MTLINQLLKVKGPSYFSVRPDETVYSAIKKMGEKDIGSVLVMDRATLVGILTERDYARNVALKGRSLRGPSLAKSCRRKSQSWGLTTPLRSRWHS